MQPGFYEKIITQSLQKELDALQDKVIERESFSKTDGSIYINRFFQTLIQRAFEQLSMEKEELAKEKIIALANELIRLISSSLKDEELLLEQITTQGEILKAYFNRSTYAQSDLKEHMKETFPLTGLSESALFTGTRTDTSLESELKKEMLTADEVLWLVSFLKFEGVRLFERVFQKLQDTGKKIKIICTVYMGATDLKAIDFLSQFSNIEIKISYNTQSERLHAKSYLFLRYTGFHTGYIGSSNLSRTALTSGLEWNLKITQQEIPHIIKKCQSTFETYWNHPNFELYDANLHREKLVLALNKGNLKSGENEMARFFDLKPFPFQQEILDKLEQCRQQGEYKNLIVAATGTGKTIMAGFDFKKFYKQHPQANFLFVAHREEILKQARYTFRQILKNNDFGELWFSGQEPKSYKHLFVSIQTLNNRLEQLQLSRNFYDYIIIDEVHHSAAPSYEKLLNYFEPKLLIGLTATPERHDGKDISAYFGHSISAEIRLPEALNSGLLCPFQYFGLSDQVDLSTVSWRRGRYDISELEKVYGEDERRVIDILRNCEKYLKEVQEVRALGFCVSKKHAMFMAQQFEKRKLKAAYLTSDNTENRNALLQQFRRKEINYLFVVDIFNEGVDIPEIDTLLFLRPTESLTVFLQQLGRGLRLHEDKTCLTILDFVGQQHQEYSFEHKFRGMLGRTHTRIKDEIENDFPHLPLGCSIVLEQTARDLILQNLSRAYRGGIQSLLQALNRFKNDYTLPATLSNFCRYTDISLKKIYDTELLWFELLQRSENKTVPSNEFNTRLARVFANTWLATDSASYFEFITVYVQTGSLDLSSIEVQRYMIMLHMDLFDEAPQTVDYHALKTKLDQQLLQPPIKEELLQYLAYRKEQLEGIEKPIQLKMPSALKLHGRYTRNQILAGLGEHNLTEKKSSREGVYRLKSWNTELFFVTLDKSEGKFNPSTLYQDYFINEELFHWQTQNSTSPTSTTGHSYIHHRETGKELLLFIREATKDEYGLTMAFVFCGRLQYVSHEGSKPMSIKWKMEEEVPAMLLSEGKKLAVGG